MSRIALVLLVSSVVAGTAASAADSAPELTPVVGFRGGAEIDGETGTADAEADASWTLGLVYDFKIRPDARIEIFYDRQRLEFESESSRFDITVDYLQAGGVYEPHPEGTRPFVAVDLGLSYVEAEGDTSVSDSLGLSGSIGGGVKVPLSGRLALRLEARGYATFSDSVFQAVCGPGCTVNFSTDGWYQLAARAGLAIRVGK